MIKKYRIILLTNIVVTNLFIYLYWRLGNGIPYLFDNNESFTTYLHAQNLLEYGFSKTAGLADESTSNLLEGHPFLYTHAGTFPRFVSYILLVFTIDSLKLHILILSILVVSISNVIFFTSVIQYFDRYISTFVLMAINLNYVYIFQWNVNTWQVWKFLFFSLFLLICHKILNSTIKPIFLTAFFMFLFYYEHIYSILYFLLLISFIFVIGVRRKQQIIFSSLIGVAISSLTLFMQNVYYSGLSVASQDIYLTFVARNFTRDPEKFVLTLREFYEKNNILFWYNVPEYNPRNILLSSLKNLLVEINNVGPILSFLVIISFVIFLFGKYLDLIPMNNQINSKLGVLCTIFYSGLLLFLFIDSGKVALIFLLIIPASYWLIGYLGSINFFRYVFFLTIFVIWIYFQLFRDSVLSDRVPNLVHLVLIIQVIIVSLILVAISSSTLDFKNLESNLSFTYSRKLLLATTMVLIVMSLLFNGYITNGYLVRSAPFALYFLTLFMAIPLVFLSKNVYDIKVVNRIRFLVICLTLTLIISFLQNIFFHAPNYLKEAEGVLRDKVNSTFLSNLHPAVINYYTNNWSILNGSITNENYLCNIGSEKIFDNSYVWLADRHKNKNYFEPDYVLLYKNPPNSHFFGNVKTFSNSQTIDDVYISVEDALKMCPDRFPQISTTPDFTLIKIKNVAK